MSPNEKYHEFVIKEINQNSLESFKLLLQVFITMKMIPTDKQLIKTIEQCIIEIFLYACHQGNTKVLKCMLENDVIKDSIPREDALNGICTCLHVKDIVHYSNFIYLLDIFNVIVEEINGTKYNLMNYCVIVDNVDALIFLKSKYKIDFNNIHRIQKDILVSTALHYTSRRIIDYLFNNKIIVAEYLKEFSETIFSNSVFMNEITQKYGYKISPPKIENIKYVPPQLRKNYSKATYKIFNSWDNSRADKDLNWRRKDIDA